MSRIGDILAGQDRAFASLEDDLTVRNYVDGGSADDWGDEGRTEHTDSPQTASGSIQLRGRPSVEAEPQGLDTEADALIMIDGDEAFVTEGGESFNGTPVSYPSEVEGPDGTIYTLVDVYDPGHGRLRCLGRSE